MSDPNTSLHFLFIRHGETQDNIDRVLQGTRDTVLTPKGLEDAEVLAEKLKSRKIDVLYHSPLKRIVQTIQPVLQSRHEIVVHSDADLIGQRLGKLEGGSYDTVDMSNPRSADGREGVENFDNFIARLRRVFAKIVGAEALNAAEGRVVAIATHGVGITSLFKSLEGTIGGDREVTGKEVVAVRGKDAYEVRWTDSDDVAEMVVRNPERLPVESGVLRWEKVNGKPFTIKIWGKKEKAL